MHRKKQESFRATLSLRQPFTDFIYTYNYGHNSWDTLLKWRPVSVIWKILLPRPPPPCTMLKLGFETGDWSSTLFGEVGGGWDSHKTCKRLLITVEITFSYFSLKYYPRSNGHNCLNGIDDEIAQCNCKPTKLCDLCTVSVVNLWLRAFCTCDTRIVGGGMGKCHSSKMLVERFLVCKI